MKTFPKPLTVKEEKYYLQKYKEGDEEAKQILIERNLRLVAHVAKKYQHPDEDADDLISIGTVGLIKAVLTFDNTKNNRLREIFGHSLRMSRRDNLAPILMKQSFGERSS